MDTSFYQGETRGEPGGNQGEGLSDVTFMLTLLTFLTLRTGRMEQDTLFFFLYISF